MALTKEFLSGLGVEGDAAARILSEHGAGLSALNAERDAALSARREAEEHAAGERAAFDAFRAESERRLAAQEKKSAYRALLQRAGVAERFLDSVLRVTPLDGVPFSDGTITDAEERLNGNRREWRDFSVHTETSGTVTTAPPEGRAADPDSMSDADYYRTYYRAARDLRQ